MQKNIHKILIISPGGIGDLIMLTPALQILKNNFSDSAIDVFIGYTPIAGEVLRGSDIISKIFAFDFKKSNLLDKIRFIFKLRKEKYDISVVATGVSPFKGGVISFLIGADNRVGETKNGRKGFFYTNASIFQASKHVIDANIKLLEVLGIKIKSIPENFFVINNEDKIFAENFIAQNNLKGRLLIGFHPGGGWNQRFRRWPKENFIELGKEIISNLKNSSVLIFGGPGEESLCLEIKNSLSLDAILVTGKKIKQIAALIDRCKIFFAADGGLAHVASATSANLITVYGPNSPIRTGTRGPRVHIIREECKYPFNFETEKGYDADRPHSCLKKITPKIALEKIKEILFSNK